MIKILNENTDSYYITDAGALLSATTGFDVKVCHDSNSHIRENIYTFILDCTDVIKHEFFDLDEHGDGITYGEVRITVAITPDRIRRIIRYEYGHTSNAFLCIYSDIINYYYPQVTTQHNEMPKEYVDFMISIGDILVKEIKDNEKQLIDILYAWQKNKMYN